MSQESLDNDGMIESADDFEAAYRSHAASIYRFMFWRTQEVMLAEDLTSSVFEKAWRSRSSFRSGSVQAWLHRIARHTLIDYWRKKKDVSVDEAKLALIPSDAAALGDTLDGAMQHDYVEQIVSQLPTTMRLVVRLRFGEGLSARQTATKLHLSESNVRVIQYRALQQLRDKLP